MENNMENWTNEDCGIITQYVNEKNYLELIRFYAKNVNLSNTKLAALFQCNRRSLGRYLSGERQVPMKIVNIILSNVGLSYTDIKIGAINQEPDCDSNGSLIWYGENELLANTLYFYRTLEWKLSRFEVSCKLNIQENVLWEYEHGKRRIPSSVVKQILDEFQLKVTELFPTIVSYDGGKTYLQLDTRFDLNLGGKQYDILIDDLYVTPTGDSVSFYMPTWPTWRYDAYTKPLLKYMPNELSMDEYYNTDPLFFEKNSENNEYYEMGDFSDKKLPPSYLHIQEFYNNVRDKRKETSLKFRIKTCIFEGNYKLNLKVIQQDKFRSFTFDLSDYVFSDSIWYKMLQDKNYFKQGTLKSYYGTDLAADSYILWPDGQFINITELYIDKFHSFHRVHGMILNNRLLYY